MIDIDRMTAERARIYRVVRDSPDWLTATAIAKAANTSSSMARHLSKHYADAGIFIRTGHFKPIMYKMGNPTAEFQKIIDEAVEIIDPPAPA